MPDVSMHQHPIQNTDFEGFMKGGDEGQCYVWITIINLSNPTISNNSFSL